jgi:hypothetical protein
VLVGEKKPLPAGNNESSSRARVLAKDENKCKCLNIERKGEG